MIPESKLLSAAVTVWISASRFFQLTLLPTLTSIVPGTNACPLMRAFTDLGCGLGVDAVRVGAAVDVEGCGLRVGAVAVVRGGAARVAAVSCRTGVEVG